MKFIDEVTIEVKAGDGGNGCCSFRREKFVPFGGPNGGNGGDGGDVIIKASKDVFTLLDLRYQQFYRAGRGQHGMGKDMDGKTGADVIIKVPVGSLIKDINSGELLADLVEAGAEVVVAKAGAGGRGNTAFASSTNRAPRRFEPGNPGEQRKCFIEIKLIADVGIIGFPNVGKSTFITRISAARPKIADYPFTTLTPNLGVVRNEKWGHFVVADLPGLIKDAHKGAGLGTKFLRHVERNKIFLHLVDGFEPKTGSIDKDFEAINKELFLHNPELKSKPQIVGINKMDLSPDPSVIKKAKEYFTSIHVPVFEISAIKGKGIDKLVESLAKQVRTNQ